MESVLENLPFSVPEDRSRIRKKNVSVFENTRLRVQIPKGVNKVILFYVEQTVTVYIVLFYVWAQMFLLICRSYAFCVLCTVKTNEQNKVLENKNI